MRLMGELGSVGQVGQIANGATNMPKIDFIRLLDVGGEHGFVAEVIYDPGNALAVAVNRAIGPGGKRGAAVAAGLVESVLDVVPRIREREGGEFVVNQDTLAELTEFVAGEDRFQLGLTDQHDLK